MKKQVIIALAAICLCCGAAAIAMAASRGPGPEQGSSAEALKAGAGQSAEEPELTVEDIRAAVRIADMDDADPAYDAAAYLIHAGAVTGKGDGRFAPYDMVTRAAAVTALYRLSGQEAPEPKSLIAELPSGSPGEALPAGGEGGVAPPAAGGEAFVVFNDVPRDSWYADAVVWADAAGIVTGSAEGGFRPGDPITRTHLAVMLQRYAQHMGLPAQGSGDLSAYTDAGQVYQYSIDAMTYVLNGGLFKTLVDDTITPDAPVSRIQLAQILTGLQAGTDPLAEEIFRRQPARAVPHASKDRHEELQAAIEEAAKRYGAVGVQVAVIEEGVVTDTYACGWATRNTDPMTADHKLRVASLSKAAVGLAAMALSEEGTVDLDAGIGDYWGFPVQNPQYPDKPVSIRAILTHTSSIFNAGDGESRSYESVKSRLRGTGFSNSVPGEIGYWSYNNYAFGVLGMTLELASGEYVDQILDRRFFDVMEIDGAFSAGTIERSDLLATLYYNGGAVSRTAATQRGMTRWAFPGATGTYFAGGLTISARDMGKLTALLAADGRYEGVQLLEEESVEVMEAFNPSPVPGGSYQAQPLRYRPELYGRGGIYYHTGSAYGVFNCMSYDPETGDGVVVLTVGASGAKDDYGIYSICSEIANAVYGAIQ